MKHLTVQEKITSIHHWALKQHEGAKLNAAAKGNLIEKANVNGKAKAYLDVVCFIQDKYGDHLLT